MSRSRSGFVEPLRDLLICGSGVSRVKRRQPGEHRGIHGCQHRFKTAGQLLGAGAANRLLESVLATFLCQLEPEHGDPLAALDHITLGIRNFYDSGNVGLIRNALATLAVFLDRLGRLEPAATIAGFAFSPLTASASPQLSTVIAHQREVLGDQTYESLARKGETMSIAAMVTYAYGQIDQARTQLEHPK